jgi:SAM-dependent methyltransferase
MTVILDLGCGNRKKEGSIGIDCNPDSMADVIHDLDRFPYPFGDSTFDVVIADNIMEHLDDIIGVLRELYRITKPHGELVITVPYFHSKWAYIDPTHRHFFTSESFSYFDVNHEFYRIYRYSDIRTRINKIIFNENIRRSGLRNVLHRILVSIANRHSAWYDSHLGHIFPLDTITFHIEILKDAPPAISPGVNYS